jgi:hypothetical protein
MTRLAFRSRALTHKRRAGYRYPSAALFLSQNLNDHLATRASRSDLLRGLVRVAEGEQLTREVSPAFRQMLFQRRTAQPDRKKAPLQLLALQKGFIVVLSKDHDLRNGWL